MDPTGGRRRADGGKKVSRASHSARRKRRCADPAKAAVMAYVERLVRDGLASRVEIDDGTTKLTLSSGEVLHLGRTSVTRIV